MKCGVYTANETQEKIKALVLSKHCTKAQERARSPQTMNKKSNHNNYKYKAIIKFNKMLEYLWVTWNKIERELQIETTYH